jgi:MFS family permease
MKRTTLIAWFVFALIVLISVGAALLDAAATRQGSVPPPWIAYLVGPVFALVGALILARQPGNRVGWLLMLPGASAFVLVDAYFGPLNEGLVPLPPTLIPGLWLALWYSGWNWTLLIFPLMWLMLLFPTGRPIGRRWRWLVWVGIGLMLFLLLLATFTTPMRPGSGDANWSYPNPIGIFEYNAVQDSALLAFFTAVMPVWVVLCLMALVVRFRRAGQVERQQMKWLFFATVVFVAAYVPVFLVADFDNATNVFNYLWMIAMLLIPAAIGIAILRYRLYDIDLIIRKTVQYGVVTAVLALIYFGTIILLQSLVGQATGEQSPIVIVLSTLLIAAMFNPLRRRVQTAVDRRFYRQKYNAQQVLAQFAITARDETDIETLQVELLRVVQDTLQPESVSVWIKPEKGKRSQG